MRERQPSQAKGADTEERSSVAGNGSWIANREHGLSLLPMTDLGQPRVIATGGLRKEGNVLSHLCMPLAIGNSFRKVLSIAGRRIDEGQ
jgi:hypothetical protein